MAYATQAQSTGTLAGRLETIFTSLRERHARRQVFRQTFHELRGLSDRELGDLGLSRSELRRVAWQAAYDN